MDSNLQNILLGVAGNALTSLLAGGARIGRKILEGSKEEVKEVDVLTVLQEAPLDAVYSISWDDYPNAEEVSVFLLSPEAEALVRQIFSTHLMRDEGHGNEELRAEFRALLNIHFNLEKDKLTRVSNDLFSAIISISSHVLDVAINSNRLLAHEIKSAIRTQIIKDELKAIKKNLEFLRSSKNLSYSVINDFETKLKDQIEYKHGRIMPPNFDDARKYKIDDIYVMPSFTKQTMDDQFIRLLASEEKYSALLMEKRGALKHLLSIKPSADFLKQKDELARHWMRLAVIEAKSEVQLMLPGVENFFMHQAASDLDFFELLSDAYRIVILGNPGGGKSTFTNKVCYELAKNYSHRLLAGRRLIPIPVILREYGVEKKNSNCSVVEFIEMTAKANYQLDPPSEIIEYMLLNGRAVIIFDGLDELLDSGYRQKIRDDIETFCNLYPSAPVIVTSREVGYEQAPLNEDIFQIYNLAPFNEDQVKEYVNKWFKIGTEWTEPVKQQRSADFIHASKSVAELCSNPLMLGLMCNIYRGENYIPRNRPDVYQKCSEMLYERWDKSRDIPTKFHFEDDIRPAMAYLAFMIYGNVDLRKGILESRLVQEITDYFLSHRFEDRDKAERAAKEFIEFCRGRAWIFTEVGTNKDGEGLYQFTHQTFLEYFTAVYLTRTYETTESLLSALIPKIYKREWDAVAQLAFQIKSRNSEGAKDKMLSALIYYDDQCNAEDKKNALLFALRCLKFTEPNPKVVREIITASLQHSIETSAKNKQGAISSKSKELTEKDFLEHLSLLFQVSDDNRPIVADSIKKFIKEKSSLTNYIESAAAFELGLDLPYYSFLAGEKQNISISKAEAEHWNSVVLDVIRENRDAIIDLTKKNVYISRKGFDYQLIGVNEVIAHHGIESLFYDKLPTAFAAPSSIPIALTLIRHSSEYLASKNVYTIPEYVDYVREIGKIYLLNTSPKIKRHKWNNVSSQLGTWCSLIFKSPVSVQSDINDPTLLFGTFILLATSIELEVKHRSNKKLLQHLTQGRLNDKSSKYLIQYIFSNKGGLFKYFWHCLMGRYKRQDPASIQTEIELCKFDSEQVKYIRGWLQRGINIVD